MFRTAPLRGISNLTRDKCVLQRLGKSFFLHLGGVETYDSLLALIYNYITATCNIYHVKNNLRFSPRGSSSSPNQRQGMRECTTSLSRGTACERGRQTQASDNHTQSRVNKYNRSKPAQSSSCAQHYKLRVPSSWASHTRGQASEPAA